MKPPKNISQKAQLIKGIGASSWFTIIAEQELYRIERFSIDGDLECSNVFFVKPSNFDINSKYKFTYLSHCRECTIIQQQQKFKFKVDED
tara:strand:+ start:177 stop:446 length:270 start_codon:yes stop_codon:yes gene_type:complete